MAKIGVRLDGLVACLVGILVILSAMPSLASIDELSAQKEETAALYNTNILLHEKSCSPVDRCKDCTSLSCSFSCDSVSVDHCKTGTRAIGFLTFCREDPAFQDILIPNSTIVASCSPTETDGAHVINRKGIFLLRYSPVNHTSFGPGIEPFSREQLENRPDTPEPEYYVTTERGVIHEGESRVNVTAVALLPGSSGNAPANTIILPQASLAQVQFVINLLPFTGGMD